MSEHQQGTSVERAKSLIGLHPVRMGNFILWVCMDDRPVTGLGDMPYRQIGGGIHGATTDFQVMAEIAKPGIFLDRSGSKYTNNETNHPIPQLARQSHFVLLQSGLLVALHEYCAAEGAAPDANTNIVRGDQDTLYKRTFEMYPDANPVVVEQTVAIHSVMARQGAFRGEPRGITRVALVNMQHVANDILANHEPGTAFDPQQAIGPDLQEPLSPAYHISYGDMPELFNPLLAHADISVTESTMRTVSAVRHAAVSLMLPNQPLTVHAVGGPYN